MKEYRVGGGTIMSHLSCDEERFDMEYKFLDMMYCFLHFIIRAVRPAWGSLARVVGWGTSVVCGGGE